MDLTKDKSNMADISFGWGGVAWLSYFGVTVVVEFRS